MENINIEEILVNNLYKLLEEEDNAKQKDIEKHINKLKEGLELVKQENKLDVLKAVYIIEEKLRPKLKQEKQTLYISYSKVFNYISVLLFFALEIGKWCNTVGSSKDDTYTIIEAPQEYVQEIITILDDNFSNWKDVIKVDVKQS